MYSLQDNLIRKLHTRNYDMIYDSFIVVLKMVESTTAHSIGEQIVF